MDKFSYTVYKHITPDGRVYIGCTRQRPESRWGTGGIGYWENHEFRKAILECGWESIKHEIIATHLDKETALALESEEIHRCKSTDIRYGYNRLPGRLHPEEISVVTRQKLSESSKKKWLLPEYRIKVSSSVSRAKLGMKFTDTHKESLRRRKLEINAIKGKQLWVHKSDIESLISESVVLDYLDAGWELGRLNEKAYYMHKLGQSDIKVTEDEVKYYEELGWSRGRGEQVSKSISRARRNYVWCYQDLEFDTSSELTVYLRGHGYPEITFSTITGIARGEIFRKYLELSGMVHKRLK